jgi:hypothetical protein
VNRGWVLIWDDEFNGPDGSPRDATKWVLESGGDGWGNEELEYYTPRRKRGKDGDSKKVQFTTGSFTLFFRCKARRGLSEVFEGFPFWQGMVGVT